MGLVTLIASETAHSETPFFIVGIVLVLFAVAMSVLGFTRPHFPGSDRAARGVMSVGAALVVVTAGLVVYINS